VEKRPNNIVKLWPEVVPDRDGQPHFEPDPSRQVVLAGRENFRLEDEEEAAGVPNSLVLARMTVSDDEERSQPQMSAKPKLRREFIRWEVWPRVFDFDAIPQAVLFEDEVEIVIRLGPHPTLVLAGVSGH
jgi:hypothetical protein